MAGKPIERMENSLAGEFNVRRFDLSGVSFRNVPGDGVSGVLIRGEPEAETGELFIQEMNAVDSHRSECRRVQA